MLALLLALGPGPGAVSLATTPAYFEGLDAVTVGELLEALRAELPQVADSAAVRADYQRFLLAHGLDTSQLDLKTYAAVHVAFEATRDGGLWGLQWDITNRSPRSDEVWSQWSDWEGEGEGITAVAECDELSALFAFVVRRLGVEEVGLFWPTGDHTVAVWTIARGQGQRPVRVVVPTSQVYLSADATLGDTTFDPWKQKTIWEYRRRDVRLDLELPAPLARRFLARVHVHAPRSGADLQRRRNRQARALGGS